MVKSMKRYLPFVNLTSLQYSTPGMEYCKGRLRDVCLAGRRRSRAGMGLAT